MGYRVANNAYTELRKHSNNAYSVTTRTQAQTRTKRYYAHTQAQTATSLPRISSLEHSRSTLDVLKRIVSFRTAEQCRLDASNEKKYSDTDCLGIGWPVLPHRLRRTIPAYQPKRPIVLILTLSGSPTRQVQFVYTAIRSRRRYRYTKHEQTRRTRIKRCALPHHIPNETLPNRMRSTLPIAHQR
jgi:hypothetical protein